MARSKFRRSLQIENLESRQLLSSVGPATAEQQDMLYWVNLARTNPPAAAQRIAANITPDIQVLQDVPDELKARSEIKGEASMRGHLSAEGAEQSGSQSYVPPVEKDDKALAAAYNLLRGVTVNAGVPSSPRAAVPN